MSFWSLLGIGPTTDKTAIRHAYAEKTKTCHPEEDPEGFDALHKAFDAAMQYARRNAGRAAALREEKAPVRAAAGTPAAGEGRAAAAQRAREAARAAEQEALEEYQQEQKRARGAELSLGRGEQESGQQFDFSAAQAAPGGAEQAVPPGTPAAQERREEPERPLTPEEQAWRNEPPPLEEPGGALPENTVGQRQPDPAREGPTRQREEGQTRHGWGFGLCAALGAAVLLLTRSAPAALAVLAAACVAAALLFKRR
ncbi:hypothetical protein [Allofournierella sp.]|uniref:hypothetical protein n=1 Tax=Allofournierella sp. TaxID=1940256 RepID=UPI003AB35405